MKGMSIVFLTLLFFFMFGCSHAPIIVSSDAYNHMIALKSNGNSYDLLERPTNSESVEVLTSQSYELGTHISQIMCELGDRKDILIYIHGGMVGIEEAAKEVEKILERPYWKENKTYPIFVNWESGLLDSYMEHLWKIRQGAVQKVWAPLTASLYLVADFGRAISRTPYVLQQQIPNSVPWQDETPRGIEKGQTDPICLNLFRKNKKVSACIDPRNSYQEWYHIGWQQTLNVVPGTLRIITTPATDTMGKSAWNNMLRRTQTIFRGPETSGNPRSKSTSNYEVGGLSQLMDALSKGKNCPESRKNHVSAKELRITLIGHSMGTIVLNEIIRRYPDLNYKYIVYLAAAATVKDFEDTVLPYMKDHSETEFFNTTLHPYADRHESNYLVLPQGSLLDWIDDFASEPKTRMDHTMGKWNNIIRVVDDIDIPEVEDGNKPIGCRIKIRGFAFADGHPMKHGEMNNLDILKKTSEDTDKKEFFQFWEKGFWETSPVFKGVPGTDLC